MFRTSKTEFMKIVKPMMNWASNCKNDLFEAINYEQTTLIGRDGEVDFCITIFFKKSNDFFKHGNTSFQFYQHHECQSLRERKAKIKEALKASTIEEFINIQSQFNKV